MEWYFIENILFDWLFSLKLLDKIERKKALISCVYIKYLLWDLNGMENSFESTREKKNLDNNEENRKRKWDK